MPTPNAVGVPSYAVMSAGPWLQSDVSHVQPRYEIPGGEGLTLRLVRNGRVPLEQKCDESVPRRLLAWPEPSWSAMIVTRAEQDRAARRVGQRHPATGAGAAITGG